ncbi:MAG: hypothetical protein ACQERZ_01125 [Fusobacteriota bacterium]
MKKKILGITLLMIFSTLSFSAGKYGAKAHAMGGAFTAIADDSSALYWNPAGLTQTSLLGLNVNLGGQVNPEELTQISDFIDTVNELEDEEDSIKKAEKLSELELPENMNARVNGMLSLNLSRFAAGVILDNEFSINSSRVDRTTSEGSFSIPAGTANNKLLAQGLFGSGFEVFDPPVLGSISLGVTGKYLYAKEDIANVSINDDANDLNITTNHSSKDAENGFGADVGALITLSDIDILNAKVGVTRRNAYTSLDEVNYPSLEKATIYGAGVTFKFPLINIFSLRVAADLEKPDNGKEITHVGAEGSLGLFSLRAGAYGEDISDEDTRIVTGGVGLNLPFLDFNLTADSDDFMSLSGTFNF